MLKLQNVGKLNKWDRLLEQILRLHFLERLHFMETLVPQKKKKKKWVSWSTEKPFQTNLCALQEELNRKSLYTWQ